MHTPVTVSMDIPLTVMGFSMAERYSLGDKLFLAELLLMGLQWVVCVPGETERKGG